MTRRLVNIMDMPDPADISESGLEAACRAIASEHYCKRFNTLPQNPIVTMNVDGNWHIFEADARLAIQAYLPFHPPASREEGLREAAKIAQVTNGAHVTVELVSQIDKDDPEREFWRGYSAAKHDIATAILALIPTKPEAKEAR